jgi:hypothetical protein
MATKDMMRGKREKVAEAGLFFKEGDSMEISWGRTQKGRELWPAFGEGRCEKDRAQMNSLVYDWVAGSPKPPRFTKISVGSVVLRCSFQR